MIELRIKRKIIVQNESIASEPDYDINAIDVEIRSP